MRVPAREAPGEDEKSPSDVRFSEVDAFLKAHAFILFNQRGSHCSYHRADGRVLTIVKPHGGRKTCHPADIRRLLKVLGDEDNA